MEFFEIMSNYIDEVNEWDNFVADMESYPYDDENWADRIEALI